MARREIQPSILARILLTEGLALLSQRHPPHIAWEILVREMAAKRLPYWPDDPDLAAVWRKLSGLREEGDPQIEHVERQENWIEFYVEGVRRPIYPIQLERQALEAWLSEDARAISSSAPTSVSKTPKRPKGPQSTRAIGALRDKLFPPDGKIPASMDIETARRQINAVTVDERKRSGKGEISRDVVDAVVNWLGRDDDR